jgi:hypothetical protein
MSPNGSDSFNLTIQPSDLDILRGTQQDDAGHYHVSFDHFYTGLVYDILVENMDATFALHDLETTLQFLEETTNVKTAERLMNKLLADEFITLIVPGPAVVDYIDGMDKFYRIKR